MSEQHRAGRIGCATVLLSTLASLMLNLVLLLALWLAGLGGPPNRILLFATPGSPETDFLKKIPESRMHEIFEAQGQLTAFIETGHYSPRPLIRLSNKVRAYKMGSRMLFLYVDNDDCIQAFHIAEKAEPGEEV